MAWIVAIGMPIALFIWFTLAYFFRVNVNDPTVAEILVDFNILLWGTISIIEIKKKFGLEILGFKSPVKTILIALSAGILIGILGFFFEFWKSKAYNFPGPYSSIPIFVSFIIGSILEEIIWRAYVLRALGFGWVGLVVSSVFFGLHHIGLSFKNFIFAIMAGFILGGFYMKTSLFWGVALGHVLANILFLPLSSAIFKSVIK